MIATYYFVKEDVGCGTSLESRLAVLEVMQDDLVTPFSAWKGGDGLAYSSIGDYYVADAHRDCQIGTPSSLVERITRPF